MRTLYGSTSWRRVLALVLVFVMMVSTMGTSGYSVFAEGPDETGEEVVVSEPEAVTPEVTVDDQGPSPGAEEVTEPVEPAAEDEEPVEAVEEAAEVEEAEEPAEAVEEAEEAEEPSEENAEPVEPTEEAIEDEEAEEPAEEVEEPVEPVEEAEGGEEAVTEDSSKPTLVEEASQIATKGDGSECEDPEAVAEPSVISDTAQLILDALTQEGEAALEELSEEELLEEELLEEELLEEVEIPTHYEAERDGVLVVVDVPEDAFTEPVELSVTTFEKGDEDYADAEAALYQAGRTFDGMMAFDISFVNNNGEKVEPDISPEERISVSMSLGQDALTELSEAENADLGSLVISHITSDGVVDVADAGDDVEGFVDTTTETESVAVAEKAPVLRKAMSKKAAPVVLETPASVATLEGVEVLVEEGPINVAEPTEKVVVTSLAASFEVDGFSTYTITWGGRSYDIHYVDTNGNSLTPARTPEYSNSERFLIYDIAGYEYESTHLGSLTGTAINPYIENYNGDRIYRTTGGSWNYLRNDIYVVYKAKTAATQGGTPSVDGDETWPDEEDPARKPQFGKSSTNNGNGTNTISLSISGAEKPVEKSTPADVIVVFDISGSMSGNMNGQTRLARAKTAVNTMANTLLNGENSDVRMALISFSTTAQTVPATGEVFTNSYNTFSGRVNGLGASGGTNWEQALQLANRMPVREDAATFIVFVTDGNPTFRVSRGDVSDSDLDEDMYYSNQNDIYTYYMNNSVFGDGNNDDYSRNFNFAVTQVSAIKGANKNFYAIGISNDVTKVQNLTTEGGVAADHAFIASDSTAMENAFKSITESIKSALGFGDIQMTDGITALTNTEMKVMQSVDPNSFKYYRYGGENNKYGNGYANKSEWTTRASDGCEAAEYDSNDGAVHWDMGSAFQLEDGVTYVVEFTVWPSQAAYDLVADLNNGVRTYSSLTNEEKAQVVEVTAPTATTTGTYALKTNTDEVSATYKKTTKQGEVVTISDSTPVATEYNVGYLQNMTLDSDFITVKKEWHNALDDRVVDGITLSVTKDGAVYLDDLTLNQGNDWTSDEQYISAGVITKTSDGRYNVRETGHEYTVTEPASFSYYWDLTADVYRPMVIDGTLTMLIKTDNPEGTEGTDYYVIGGSSYQVSDDTNPQLVAQNNRRSNLNLKKLVTANTQAVDNVPDPDDVFTYTITVTDINGDDVWFGAQDENGATVLIETYSANVTPQVDADNNPTGSYSVRSGAQFTISIKAGWNVRFFNLPTGTTYSIQETGMVDGYEFVKAETSAEVTNPDYADDYQATPGAVSGNTVTGTIDQPNNIYSTEYTNNWNPDNEIIIKKVDENNNGLAGAGFTLYKLDGDSWKKVATFTSKADAGETLKVGRGFYKLEETAPTYYKAVDPIYFEVITGGNTTTIVFTDENREATTEDEVPVSYSYATVSGNKITVSNMPDTTNITVMKSWEDDSDRDGIRPETLALTLKANGTAVSGTTPTVVKDGNSWTYTWSGLPMIANGTAIEYTVTEGTVPEGYSCETTTVAAGGTITNTHSIATTSVTATKAWADDSDRDGIRPETLALTLKANGTAVSDATPTIAKDGNSWTYTWSGLPTNDGGEAITYTVTEEAVPSGYTCETTTVAAGGTITNTHNIETTSVTATKAWADDSDRDGIRPETLALTLKANGTAVSDATPTIVKDGNSWTYTWSGLPTNDGGEAITYTVTEEAVPSGYTCETTTVEAGGTITNTHNIETTSVTVTKAWADDSDRDGIRPETLALTLKANGTAVSDATPTIVKDGNSWTYTWSGLPTNDGGEAITYTVTEEAVPSGYSCETTTVAAGGTITNTHNIATTSVTVTKAWADDYNNVAETRPESITVTLSGTYNADNTEKSVTITGAEATIKPTEDGIWSYTWTELPVKAEGQAINYTVAEATVTGYTAEIGEVSGNAENGFSFTITNTYSATPVSVDPPVKKVIEGTDELYNKGDFTFKIENTVAPEGVTAPMPKNTTIKNIAEYERPEPDMKGFYEFGNIVFTIPGTYTYTVTESGSAPCVTNDKESTKTITFTVTQNNAGELKVTPTTDSAVFTFTNVYADVSATVKKVWDDKDNQDGKRPDSITVTLSNGEVVTLSEKNDWTATVDKLPKFDANGEPITYAWTEGDMPEGYTLKGDPEVKGTVTTLTNSYTPGITNVSGRKTWNDNENQDGKRPASITVNLLANGQTVQSKTVTAEDGWAWNFTELPEYSNGTKITYTVKEGAVEGYTPEVNGYSITNTHEVEKINVTVTKTWSDYNNQYNTRPQSITVQLYADDKVSGDPVTITAENAGEDGKWTYTYTGLDKYEAGKEIVYTVKEEAVSGYTTTINGLDITNSYVRNTPSRPPKPPVEEPDEPIEDPDTPLAPIEEDPEIDDPETPLAPYEEEPDEEISEEPTPLSPYTGDDRHTAVWGFVSLLSLAGIVVVARKRREEE